MVTVQVADLSHENFKSSQVMSLSRLSSHFGAKSSRERKPQVTPRSNDKYMLTSTMAEMVPRHVQHILKSKLPPLMDHTQCMTYTLHVAHCVSNKILLFN